MSSYDANLHWRPIPVGRRIGYEPEVGPTECVYRRADRGRPGGAAAVPRDGVTPMGYDVLPLERRNVAAVAPRGDAHPLHGPRLLIVDDCTLYRETLAAVIAVDGAPPPSKAWDLPSLFAALAGGKPNLVLINLDTRDSAMLLHAALEVRPDIRVIVLGVSEDDEAGIVACAEAGVAGYHLRSESLDELLVLIRRVADGETFCSPQVSAILLRRLSTLASQRPMAPKELVLTSREAQILRMLELGMSNRDIASELCIAVHTVKNHVHSVLTKLGVSTRAEAAARFRSVRFSEGRPEN
ncbi:response regulator transcription factor [Mycobacterium sp. ACS4331]|uniref:LuxR C-terminal-related transcriptional regulator n=1 Tax=Mycobacterium sp. ACS4331 TaxID=1834121 RepID=UPI0009EEEDA2|nr:response regulator transcription factor [Mycobacterium sp. ACS4331]